MRRLIVQQWVTVDNIAAEENGGLSFVSVDPGGKMKENAFSKSIMDFINSVDTMIIGANTYAMFKGYWPTTTVEGEFGEKLNHLTKFVASTTLSEAPWGDFPPATVTADPVATVQKLKQEDGKDIVLWGSLTLMNTMFEAGLVDEVQMRVCPTTRGKGTHLFTDRKDLKLLEATPYENEIVLLRYEVQKES